MVSRERSSENFTTAPRSQWNQPSSSSSSRAAMLGPGPASSFYDPSSEDLTNPFQRAQEQQYQQWIASYDVQQQQQQQSQQQQQQISYHNAFGGGGVGGGAGRDSQQIAFSYTNRLYTPAQPQENSYSDEQGFGFQQQQQQQQDDPYNFFLFQQQQQQQQQHPSSYSRTHQTDELIHSSGRSLSASQSPDPFVLPTTAASTSSSSATATVTAAVSATAAPPSAPKSKPPPVTKKAGKAAAATAASTPPKSAAGKRKRSRKTPDDDSDSDNSDYDDFGGGISVGMGGLGVGGSGSRPRLPGACTHCKKLKMKCDFPENENTCRRCKTGGHVCIVEGRKQRTAPNKREYLLAQIRQKDAIIESLLKQLHNPYVATPLSIASYRMATSPSDQNNKNVLAWLDRLQASVRDTGGKGGPSAFRLDGRSGVDSNNNNRNDETQNDNESDRDSDLAVVTSSRLTHAQRYGLLPVDPDDDNADPLLASSSSVTGADNGGGGGATGNGATGADEDEDGCKIQSSLPDSHVPLGLIANLSLSQHVKTKAGKSSKDKDDTLNEDDDDDNVGVANATYFMPGPATDLGLRAMLIEQHSPPEILVHGLVTPDDVDKLFNIFYTRINPFLSLLDPVLHTPASTFARCPFLFTVVCAVSSRYYTDKSEIYPIAMHFAKHSAANALIDGWKSVELCQAYILMATYAVPARRWEEDRSWLYTGLAIRIATDLNLHQMSAPTKPQNEKQEREILNRTRVWMICFNLDRSTATQFGKPSTIKEDYIMRHSQDWYKKSVYNHPYDAHLCGYSSLLRIVAKFHEEIFSDPNSPSGLNKQLDFQEVTLRHDAHLSRFKEEWTQRFRDAAQQHSDDRGSELRSMLLPFLVGYSRLVMFSFGFQQAYQRGMQSADSLFFSKCLESARTVIKTMIDDLAPTTYMRYAPDGHFVFASFASAFLLKLLRPEFAKFLSRDEETEIFDLIGRLIQTLSSPSIAIDDRHTPKLHARFLASLLSRHRRDGAMVGRLHTQPPPANQIQAPPPKPTEMGYDNSSSAMTTTFSQGGASMQVQDYQQGYGQTTNAVSTPIYRPEATYAVGAGQIQFGGDFGLVNLAGNAASDEEMLAAMQALKNPSWWQSMMMPGFSWSDPGSPASNKSSPSYHGQTPGINPSGFGIFHAAQPVPLL